MVRRRSFIAAAACSLAVPAVFAQSSNARAVRIVVPFAPGGATDALARAIAQRFTELTGQTAFVENRAGASGNIGTDLVARAKPDGLTLLLTINSHVVNPSLYKNLPFDAIKDFQPLTLVADAPNVLVARPNFPADTVAALITLAKQKRDQITYASAGTGSGSHLAGVLFDSMAGVKMVHVPYKGVTVAMTDIMGGQVDLCFSVLSVIYPLVTANKVKPIAIAALKRSALLPNLPTVDESGLPGFDVSSWFGLFLPANPAPDVLSRLQETLEKITQASDFRQSFSKQGLNIIGNTPQEFEAFLRKDQALWTRIIQENDIRID